MATNYKLVKSYVFLHNANLDFIRLKNEGLDVYMADDNLVSLAPFYSQAVGGIKIFVAKKDLSKAQEILSNDKIHDEELNELFDDQELEPAMRCPNCNSPNIFQAHSILSGLMFLLLFFLPVSVTKNKYHCVNCNHHWKL